MDLFSKIKVGDKSALAKAITLIESTLEKDVKNAQNILLKCNPLSGNSIRIGITGIPGVGKSTFIDTFGKLLTKKGHKVAVLAIDPSSKKTEGCILGDKSRMNNLSIDSNAFIRPSPSSGTLGGVGSKTRETIILCEAAGYDIILIETVGVGQSEINVSQVVDFFLLLMISGAGDELQGIKRGIMELADMLVVNKADGDNIQNAKNAAQKYKQALHLTSPMENGWTTKVSVCSAIKNKGIENIYQTIISFVANMKNNNWMNKKREKQNIFWLHEKIKFEFGNQKYNQLKRNKKIYELEKKAIKGKILNELLKEI